MAQMLNLGGNHHLGKRRRNKRESGRKVAEEIVRLGKIQEVGSDNECYIKQRSQME